VEAAELPASLPALRSAQHSPEQAGTDSPAPKRNAGNTRDRADQPADIADVVSRAVSRQIAPLRRELHELKERERLQDILGGVGYLIGIAGIAFYFLGARRNAQEGPQTGTRPD